MVLHEDQALPAPYPPEDAPIHQSIQRLQNAQSNWWGKLGLLAVTLVLFVVAFSFMSFGGAGDGRFDDIRQRLWWIIPVLAFHELGHYLAMRLFGYRNVRMFFIPFLGAAVSGKHYNVPGWKKAVVALAGPVPGIVLGLAVGMANLYFRQVELRWLAGFLLVLNAIQLLPLLPLDGGWVVHAVLFARHPVLEGVFRIIAALALLGFGLLLRDYVVGILGGIMLLAVPAAWRMAAAADRLRQRGGVPASPDGQTIPPDAVTPILTELRAGTTAQLSPALMAQQVVSVYEMLNARPPGLLDSLLLLALQFGSLAAVVVLAVTAAVALHWDQLRGAPEGPALAFEAGELASWRGPKAPTPPGDRRVTFVAHFGGSNDAREQFQALQKEVPENASLVWFGRSVLLTLADDHAETRHRWKERLRRVAERVAEDGQGISAPVRLHATAPDEATAGRIQSQLREYLIEEHLTRPMLLPPWSAAWQELPEKDRLRFEKARRTLVRAHAVSREASQAPEVRKLLSEQFLERDLARDPKWFNEQMEKIGRAVSEERKRRLDALRAEAGADLDVGVIDDWAVLAEVTRLSRGDKKAAEAALKEQARLRRRLAERLGAYPAAGDGLLPGSNRDAAVYGYARGEGERVEVDVAFSDITVGLPALAGWLAGQGCAGLVYDVTSMDFDQKADPEDP